MQIYTVSPFEFELRRYAVNLKLSALCFDMHEPGQYSFAISSQLWNTSLLFVTFVICKLPILHQLFTGLVMLVPSFNRHEIPNLPSN
jgi:hypothetical protein